MENNHIEDIEDTRVLINDYNDYEGLTGCLVDTEKAIQATIKQNQVNEKLQARLERKRVNVIKEREVIRQWL